MSRKAAMKNVFEMWVIKDRHGRIFENSLSIKRQESIDLFIEEGDIAWLYYVRRKYHCTKVIVTINQSVKSLL